MTFPGDLTHLNIYSQISRDRLIYKMCVRKIILRLNYQTYSYEIRKRAAGA